MLKYNTFRSDRYLRSKFLEGRYFLASEASDLELEIIDQLRRMTQSIIGDVAVEDAWKVSVLSSNQILIAPGEAWFKGLPFALRSSSDQLVSGASLTSGIIPPGVTITDATSSAGKILTFTNITTPSNTYKIVISAEEQIVTDVADPFLKNANIPESTSQKIRILFKLNIVVNGSQTETPIPYTPESGTYDTANMVNQILVTPSAGQNGELLLVNPISGSEQIDGRNLELTIRNDSSIGDGVKIPNGTSDQQAFYNGKLVDAVGAEYHINAIFNDTVSTQVIIRLDKEVGQPNPSLTNGITYKLIKRDVYVTDDVSGNPLGRLYWPIANVVWNSTIGYGFVHSSVITDLRERVISKEEFEDVVNQKLNIQITGGGVIDVDTDGETLNWSADFNLINPSGASQTIAASSAVLVEGGTLTYEMNFAGGPIAVGNLSVTVSGNVGPVTSFSGGPDLTLVKLGNIIKVGSEVAEITAIDNVNKTVTVSPSLTTIGSGTIYRDSFAEGTVLLKENLFVLAVRKDNKIRVADDLELSAGESNAIYDVRINYPAGLAASTNITLPNNSQTSKPQYYSSTKRNLEVYVNQLLKFQGVDWLPVDNQTIQFVYDLPNDTEVHFRMDSLPAGSVGGGGSGGGGGTLQDAYDAGNSIVTSGGLPFVVSGTAPKVASFIGDIEVTGVIDPAGLELTPQASNPLDVGQRGIWTNLTNQLVYENGTTTENISQRFDDLESGASNPIVGSASILKTGNVLSTLSAPKVTADFIAGEAFVANLSYLVRWGIDPEISSRVYKADANNALDNNYTAIGLLLSTFSIGAGDFAKVTTTGTHVLGSSDTPFLTADIGKFVYLTNDGTGGFTTIAPTNVGDAQYRVGVVQDVDKIWVDFRQLDAVVPIPLYDERITYSSGLAAATDITIPLNSRNDNTQQTYIFAEGRLKVYVNQVLKFQGVDWIAGTSPTTQIQFSYALPNDSEVHFRIEPIGSGVLSSGVGVSGTLQDAYDNGDVITTTSGNPLTINGPVSEKLLVINGDIEVTGVIDPIAIQLTPTASNPLQAGQAGMWVDMSGALMQEDGTNPAINITQVVNQVVEGTAVTSISRNYLNNTGVTIPAKTPVYSPVVGEIEPADNSDNNKYRVIGITAEAIDDGDSGLVIIAGTVEGIIGLTHNSYIFVGLTPGSLTDVAPVLGPYPAGFDVVRLGILEGTNLHLQIQHVGTL